MNNRIRNLSRSFSQALLLVLLAVGCEEDPMPDHPGVIPQAIQPYVDRFLWEAEQRGYSFNIDHLSVEFERDINIPIADSQQVVVGSCTRIGNQQLIKLDTLNSLWLLSGFLGREEIVFHELGHCLLGRAHRDDTFKSGDFASIMRSAGLLQYGDLDRYNTLLNDNKRQKAHRRDYYIDELFSQSVEPPCWADSGTLPNLPVEEFTEDIIINRQYFRIWMDPDSNPWFFGREGNYRYSPENGFESLLPGISITSMTNSATNEIWLSGVQEDRNLIATFVNEQLDIRYTPEMLPANLLSIDQLLVDDMDRIWISDRGGDLFVNSGAGFKKVEIPSRIRVSSIKKTPDNKIYVLKEGLLYLVEDETSFVQVGQENTDLPTSYFRRLEVDGQGNLWLQPAGTAQYLVKLSPEWEVDRIDFNQVNINELQINEIAGDPNGTIWIATSNGIRKWQDHKFTKYCEYNTGLKVLDFNTIRVGSDGNVWAVGRDRTNDLYTLLKIQPGT